MASIYDRFTEEEKLRRFLNNVKFSNFVSPQHFGKFATINNSVMRIIDLQMTIKFPLVCEEVGTGKIYKFKEEEVFKFD